MSASTQEQGGPPIKPARKDWELFWRIVAGLMLLVIGWMVWVLYQISPRSVVTPLAYATKVRPISAQVPAITAPVAGSPAAADPKMEAAQLAAKSGTHQAVADGQAAFSEYKPGAIGAEGLKLATELSSPLAQKPADPKTQEGKPAGAPANTTGAGAAGKIRP